MESERQRLSRLKPNLERRARIYELTRAFFRDRGFLEVDTPIRVPTVAPELYITPQESEGWFLVTSPELHMKRLLAAGYDRIFQINHCFRRSERGRLHNPEFSLLEWYRAEGNYLDTIRDTEELFATIADGLGLGTSISYQGHEIDLTPPWPRITVQDAFLQFARWDPVLEPDALRFDDDLVLKVIPAFPYDRPTVLLDYPAPMASLARLKPGDCGVSERAEVFIGGLELANAYSELADPSEQACRFEEEMARIREVRCCPPMPLSFLDALPHFPESGGIALGMDRLVMLFCDSSSIDEVLAFTEDTA